MLSELVLKDREFIKSNIVDRTTATKLRQGYYYCPSFLTMAKLSKYFKLPIDDIYLLWFEEYLDNEYVKERIDNA